MTMILLYATTSVCFGLTGIAFLAMAPRLAVVTMAGALAALAYAFPLEAGTPAMPDGRLAAEPWRVLAVAPLTDTRFLVSVRYAAGDIRTYDLDLPEAEQRDRFLQAQASLKKGRVMLGRARHGRAGLENAGEMDFDFREAPESEPKAHSS